MSLTCAEARIMASDLLDENLTEAERSALLEHIQSCASCPQLYRSMASVYQHLRAATPVLPPSVLRERIRRLFTPYGSERD